MLGLACTAGSRNVLLARQLNCRIVDKSGKIVPEMSACRSTKQWWLQVRVGLEAGEEGTSYQKRVGHMRLLGELYNYRIIDSRTVFDTLYTLLAFGHDSPETAALLDPPTSYFRVRSTLPL